MAPDFITFATDLVQIRQELLCLVGELLERRWPGKVQAARLSEHGFVLELSIDRDTDVDLNHLTELTKQQLQKQVDEPMDAWTFALFRQRTVETSVIRIRGLAFGSKAALQRFRTRRRAIRQSNSKRLGQQQELFTLPTSMGGSDPIWLPAGMAIREEITRHIDHVVFQAGFRPIRNGLNPQHVLHYLHSARCKQAFETGVDLVREHYKGKERTYTRTATTLWSLSSQAESEKQRRRIDSLAEQIAQTFKLLDFKVMDRHGRDGLLRWVYLAQNRVRRSIVLGDLVTHPLEDFSAKETLFEAHLPRAHEELFYFLLEHYGGAWPTWLAPTQVVVLPVGAKWEAYAQTVTQRLHAEGIRVRLSAGKERLAKRVRAEIVNKTPHLITVGAAEEQSDSVCWRRRKDGVTEIHPLDSFVNRFQLIRQPEGHTRS